MAWIGLTVMLMPPSGGIDDRDPERAMTGADRQDRGAPLRVLILIPSLAIGGAEMDLVRNLPRIDRTRFKVVVYTFLQRGSLADQLIEAGIEVVGPMPRPPQWRQRLSPWLRRVARWLRATLAKWRLAAVARDPRTAVPRPNPASIRQRLRRLGLDFLSVALTAMRARRLHVVANLASLRPGARSYSHIARAVGTYIQEADIHVIHAVLPISYVMAGIGNSAAGWRPLVMSRVSLNDYQQQHDVIGVIERAALHRAVDIAIGNSTAILDELEQEGVTREKLRLVYNGIDSARFRSELIDRRCARDRLGLAPSTLVFSSVANFWPYKGHADLLHAMRLFREQGPADWTLLIVGRNVDDNRAELLRLTDELGLAGHVRFLGERPDVAAILSAGDIHVSASHTEGLPNNVVEAMCAALPVVATAVGGVPELVVDGQTGLLVPKQDPKALADALGALAKDRDRRLAMGLAGQARIEAEFSIERSVAALEEIYGRFARPRTSA